MPIIGVPLKPGNTDANVGELHVQLLALGAVIASGEQTGKNFGPSTAAAVRAFRQRYGLPAGDTVDLPTGRLMHVASTFASGGRAPLRAAVREAAPAADTSQPQELYWLARYATLAGDYQTAHSIAGRIPDHPDVKAVIDPILTLPDQAQPTPGQPPLAPPPRPPEVPYPENFYTYRYKLLPQEDLDELLAAASALSGPSARMMIRPRVGRDGEGEWPDLPDEPEPEPEPPPDTPPDPDRQKALLESAASWLKAVDHWQFGNEEFNKRRYASAVSAYTSCQKYALNYFAKFYAAVDFGDRNVQLSLEQRVNSYVVTLINNETRWSSMWEAIRQRRLMLTLQELGTHDWSAVTKKAPLWLGREEEANPPSITAFRQRSLDRPLLILATIMVPLARAEANRLRRQYDAAGRDLSRVLRPYQVRVGGTPPTVRDVWLTCDFIELPFARLLLAETQLDQADAEYKARTPAKRTRAPDVTQFQSLKAAQTYLAIKDLFKDEEAYVSRVETAATELTEAIRQRLVANDTRSPEFQLLGKAILIRTVTSNSTTLPGLDRRAKAHEPLLKFTPPAGQAVMRETNPRVYAALLTATARLEQLRAGFNYLGYLDTYVPPWRFQFLLERARYFAEHAKNAQRDYLNFLSNAEREEFQELSASQNVEMEKSNVRIETARVDQVRFEVAAAQESEELAGITANNSQLRIKRFMKFDERMNELESDSFWGSVIGGVALVGLAATGVGAAALATAAGAAVVGKAGVEGALNAFNTRTSNSKAGEERDLELYNLGLAKAEADQAAEVAAANRRVSQAGLLVAGLQRQAALLRHEFALQNLEFLRNRVLNAEQWYRLVVAIRSVSVTYLRYSVELAFLAEQAYEFEADKRINVIRFDYDLSEVGDFLAADFLMRDLDTLEQDLIVTQRQRQQQVRYVLSMAREFPEALQEIRDTGKTTFSLRLEQIEKRFPGLYNLRIGAVDVLPIALLDSTRFSLELTHLGTSQVRLKAQPDTPPGIPSSSPLNTNDLPVPTGGWLAKLQEAWPIKLRVTGPETDVFSGLTRQEASAVFTVATTGQRHAFEALGAAAAWQVDFTARDNQVVPDSLADLLITFTLSGYHDSGLRAAIDAVKPQTTALTSFLSAQQIFPDALYDFSRTGRMVWKVPREMLVLNGDLGRLRNIGFSLRPGASNVHFSRLMTRLRVSFRINERGGVASGVTVFTAIPETSVTQTAPLTVAVRATLNTATELAWDFGDGTPSTPPRITPAEGTHVYAKPGRYVIKLRCVQNDSLSEFRISVAVSRNHKLGDPLIVHLPRFTFDTTAPTLTITTGTLTITTGGAVQEAGRILWRVGDLSAEGNSATFTLKPGHYTLDFAAVRRLNFRAYGAQRFVKDLAPLPLLGLSATTNRTFDQNGNEIRRGTPPLPVRNELAKRLFDEGAISPEDDWTFELIPEEILGLPAGTAIGAEQLDLSEIQDVVLSMEYDITPGGP